MKKFLKYHVFWIVILIASLWQGRYLFGSGFYTFSDESHIANLHQMIEAFRSGQIPPRWAPNFSYNFGHPFFIFYYLLPYYIGSGLNILLGLSLIWSLKITFFITIIASGLAMYFLARHFFTKIVSLAVSLIYLFTPYRAVDLYVRGAVGEMFGFVLMPLTLLSFILVIKNKNIKNFIFAVISLFLLIISHNLTFIIFFPVLIFLSFIYLIANYPTFERKKIIFKIIKIIFISFCLASFYLIPAFLERKYMQSGTPFDPIDHFPFIKQLIIPYWGYGASVWGPTDQLSFNIGLANIIGCIIITPLILLFISLKNRKFIIGLLICFFASIFMMNIRSYPIWEIIPISSYIQFPWRFLIITTFLTPLLIGFISYKKNLSWIPIFLAFIAIFSTARYFKPHKILNVDDNYFLNRFFINQNIQGDLSLISSEYKFNSEDYLPLTKWTKQRPDFLPSKIEINPNIIVTNINYQSEISIKFDTQSTKPEILKINNYYYPGWQAKIDNKNTNIFPVDDIGRIGINIPEGQHQVIISFKNTPLRSFANLLSLLSLGSFIILIIREKKS